VYVHAITLECHSVWWNLSLRAERVFPHQCSRRARSIALLEVFFNYDTVLVENKDARVWHPVVLVPHRDAIERVLLGHMLVQQSKPANDVAALIRHQWKGDPAFVGESGQRLDGVVTKSEQRDACALELRPGGLQLHELPFAVWSPTRTSVDDDHGAFAVPLGVQIEHAACLIGQPNIWKSGANRRPNAFKIKDGKSRATGHGNASLAPTKARVWSARL
jgi:hypothetical protein